MMGIFRNPHESAYQVALEVELTMMQQPDQGNATRSGGFLNGSTYPAKREASMHALQVTAVVAVLVTSLGATLVVFPGAQTEAKISAVQSASMNVLQMNFDHQGTNSLPVENIHDMTFVYP